MNSDPEQFTDNYCDLCLSPQRGSANAYGMNLCHPSDGIDCYRIVTVYNGAVADWERAHTDRKVQPDYLTRRYWAVMVASHKTFGLPEPSRWRKWLGLGDLR